MPRDYYAYASKELVAIIDSKLKSESNRTNAYIANQVGASRRLVAMRRDLAEKTGVIAAVRDFWIDASGHKRKYIAPKLKRAAKGPAEQPEMPKITEVKDALDSGMTIAQIAAQLGVERNIVVAFVRVHEIDVPRWQQRELKKDDVRIITVAVNTLAGVAHGLKMVDFEKTEAIDDAKALYDEAIESMKTIRRMTSWLRKAAS